MNHYERNIVNLALNIQRVKTAGRYIDYEHVPVGMLPSVTSVCSQDRERYQKLFEIQLEEACMHLLMHRSDTRIEDYVGGGTGI